MKDKESVKRAGILGGLGPMATCYFFNRIITHTDAARDQEHIDICILNHATIPDRTSAILTGEAEAFLKEAKEDCRKLADMGAEYIAIPCNTTHYFYDALAEASPIPILHMVRETIKDVITKYPDVQKVGIMATDGTVHANVYGRECAAYGIQAVYPAPLMQTAVMHIIYNEIKQGKVGSLDIFSQVADSLREQGCQVMILACTELSILKDEYPLPDDIVDAMDVLVRRFVEMSGRPYKEL